MEKATRRESLRGVNRLPCTSGLDRRQRLPAIEFQEGISRLKRGRDVGQVRAACLAQRRHRRLAPVGPAAENHPQMMGVHVLARLYDAAVADLMNEAMPVVVDRAIV